MSDIGKMLRFCFMDKMDEMLAIRTMNLEC